MLDRILTSLSGNRDLAELQNALASIADKLRNTRNPGARALEKTNRGPRVAPAP